MVEYSGLNLVFVFYVLNMDMFGTILWITWFTVLGFFKVYTVVARERSRYYMTAPAIDNIQTKHGRLISLLLVIVICNVVLVLFSALVLGFSNIGMLLFMIYESWIILLESTQTILKFKMFLDEFYHLKAWEGREEIGYQLGEYMMKHVMITICVKEKI